MLVISGATTGDDPGAELNRDLLHSSCRSIGSTMGTRDELERLARFVIVTGIRPQIDSTLPLAEAREGFARMVEGASRARSSSPS